MNRNLFRQLNILVLIGVFGLAAGSARAADLYVATTGDNSNDGTWAGAFTTLQAAIDAASPNDTIYLKGETFTLTGPNPDTGLLYWGPGKNGLTIAGGFVGTGPEPGPLGDMPTVLSGPSSQPSTPSTTNRVLYVDAVTNGTLSRVTIQGGSIGGAVQHAGRIDAQGAGIYVNASSNLMLSAVTLTGNTIYSGQSKQSYGAGLFATGSYGILTNSVVRGNTLSLGFFAPHLGAGIHLADGAWTVRDTSIRDNAIGTSSSYGDTRRGAGLYIASGVHTIKNCLITRNVAGPSVTAAQGEGIYIANGTVVIENCTLYWNRVEGLRRAGGTVTLRDSIAWANAADVVGTVTLENATVQSNGDPDPLFVRGLYLAPDSDCVNAGSQTAVAAGLAGYTTQANGTLDTGTVDRGYHFPAGVTDYYVDVNTGNDGNGGTSSGSPLKSITRAIALAADGSHIHVAAGEYTTDFETFPLSLNHTYGMQLHGAGAETTILNAAGAGARAVTVNYNYPDALVRGLRMINANWSVPGGNWGSPGTLGIALYAGNVQGTIESCVATNNTAPRYGGGNGASGYPAGTIHAEKSSVVITNCTVMHNASISGYAEGYHAIGISVNGDDAMIVNCVVASNSNTGSTHPSYGFGRGSGLYLNGNGRVRNCLIFGNSGYSSQHPTRPIQGQGAYVGGGTWVFENVTMATNWNRGVIADSEGLRVAAGTVTVNNSILWGNGDDIVGTGHARLLEH